LVSKHLKWSLLFLERQWEQVVLGFLQWYLNLLKNRRDWHLRVWIPLDSAQEMDLALVVLNHLLEEWSQMPLYWVVETWHGWQ
jgi:hypothetical protein